jgi:hypothetical protein
VDINPADLYYNCDVCVAKKIIWPLNNTVAGATRHFFKEAEIKTKFEVVFCLSFLFYCQFMINYRNISLADYLSLVHFMFILLTTVKLSNKKMAGATPLSPTGCITAANSFIQSVAGIRQTFRNSAKKCRLYRLKFDSRLFW